MQLRLIEYFVAVAREQHFARAALDCNVSQPTLSAGIAALEAQLGRRLIERDRRFIALTPEGAMALPWAQQIVAACAGFGASARPLKALLQGELRLGAIPASMPVVGYVADTLRRLYPQMRLLVRSLASREISQGLGAFELDAGLTYLDHEPLSQVVSVPLYGERFLFVVAAGMASAPSTSIGWQQALGMPLCLLHPGMQNRRILDDQLAKRRLKAEPSITADSYTALIAAIRSGIFATIMPDSYAAMLPAWARMVPFDDPMPLQVIGLVVPDRAPLPPLALAAMTIAEQLDLPALFGDPS